MPTALNDFVKAVEKIAPLSMACDWDNSGLMLRSSDSVSRVMITLDVTGAAVGEAEESGCDMILAHHPLIFEPLKSLDYRNTADAILMRLIKAGISLYTAHTSYDKAGEGMNDSLAKKLGLSRIEILQEDGEGFLRTGYLQKPFNVREFADNVKQALGVSTLRVSCSNVESIEKVAVVGGSGGNFIDAVKEAGAQALVTGEAKHHHFLNAQAQDILLVEAGHFETERLFAEQVFMSLQSRLNELQLDVELFKANSVQSPYEYI